MGAEDAAIGDEAGKHPHALKPKRFRILQLKRDRLIIALHPIDCIVVKEVAGAIEDRCAGVQPDSEEDVAGVTEDDIGPGFDPLVSAAAVLLRWTVAGVAAPVRRDDAQVCRVIELGECGAQAGIRIFDLVQRRIPDAAAFGRSRPLCLVVGRSGPALRSPSRLLSTERDGVVVEVGAGAGVGDVMGVEHGQHRAEFLRRKVEHVIIGQRNHLDAGGLEAGDVDGIAAEVEHLPALAGSVPHARE